MDLLSYFKKNYKERKKGSNEFIVLKRSEYDAKGYNYRIMVRVTGSTLLNNEGLDIELYGETPYGSVDIPADLKKFSVKATDYHLLEGKAKAILNSNSKDRRPLFWMFKGFSDTLNTIADHLKDYNKV